MKKIRYKCNEMLFKYKKLMKNIYLMTYLSKKKYAQITQK